MFRAVWQSSPYLLAFHVAMASCGKLVQACGYPVLPGHRELLSVSDGPPQLLNHQAMQVPRICSGLSALAEPWQSRSFLCKALGRLVAEDELRWRD